jgi:WD40 repeat protein
MLISCSGDHSVRIWDTKISKILEEIRPKILDYHKMAVRDFILVNNTLLVTGSFDETI